MSKYYLVAAYYDGKNFVNEVQIDGLGEYSLKSLRDIDLFTSSHSLQEIIHILEKYYDIDPRSSVSVKRYKNVNATPDYYKAIISNKKYNETILDMQEITYAISGHRMRTLAVFRDSSLFKEEFLKLDYMLKSKDMAKFKEVYPYDNQFSLAVSRYMSDAYDNDFEREKDYETIQNEFSRYKTFRSWIVNQDKLKRFQNQTSRVRKSVKVRNTKEVSKGGRNTIEEYEEAYNQQFMEKNSVSYDSYQTRKHNLSHLESDKEEFLDEEEFKAMDDGSGRWR